MYIHEPQEGNTYTYILNTRSQEAISVTVSNWKPNSVMYSIKLHLYASWSHIGGERGGGRAALTITIRTRSWVAARPGRFTPGQNVAGTNPTEGWVGPRVGLDILKNRQDSFPGRIRTPDRPACSPVSISTTAPKIIPNLAVDICRGRAQRAASYFKWLLDAFTWVRFLEEGMYHVWDEKWIENFSLKKSQVKRPRFVQEDNTKRKLNEMLFIWRALVNTALNLLRSHKRRETLIAKTEGKTLQEPYRLRYKSGRPVWRLGRHEDSPLQRWSMRKLQIRISEKQ